MDRRSFIKGAAAAFAMPLIYRGSLFGVGNSGPNSRCNVGVIGCGSQAAGHLNAVLSMPNAVLAAVCDVDDRRLKYWSEKGERRYKDQGLSGVKPKTFKDFRELLADPSIDAVYVTTPDHWHAYICIMAARAGKAIYCEKPMTFTIEEARMVTDAVRKARVVFQVGSQQRSQESFRHAAQLARNGRLGKIKNVWVGLNYGLATTKNWEYEAVPEGIDWDMWCGPAPYNPYSQQLLPLLKGFDAPYAGMIASQWRDHIDYGNSNQADFGAHHYDIALWGLGLDGKGPKRVVVSDRGDIPGLQNWRQYYYETEDGVKIYKGKPDKSVCPVEYPVIFEGEEGVVAADRGGMEKFWGSKEYYKDLKNMDGDEVYFKSPENNHRDNFFQAVFTGSPTVAPVEGGRSSAEISIMGNIAFRLGRTLEWDWNAGEFLGDPEANRLRSRPSRGEWALI